MGPGELWRRLLQVPFPFRERPLRERTVIALLLQQCLRSTDRVIVGGWEGT